MRQSTLVLALLVSFLLPTNSSAEWKKYASVRENTYYFGPDVKGDGYGNLYVSELVGLSEPNFKGTLSSKVSYEVMCLAMAYRSLEFTFYKQRMGKGEGKSEKSKRQDWKEALEHERQYKLIEEACSASIRQ